MLQASLKQDESWPSIYGLLALIRKFQVSSQVMIRRLQDFESQQPHVVGDTVIYSIHVSRTQSDDPTKPSVLTRVWKFGRMKKMVAYNMNGPNVKVDTLLKLMETRSLSEPHESEGVLVRGELGQIPTGRYNFGCSWEDRDDASLLTM